MTPPRPQIPSALLQKIKEGVNLVDVVGETVVLKKSGSNYSGLCPFHSERSPSFSVNERKQLYHCFGCDASGDLIAYVMNLHGLSFLEAVEELAERANVPLPEGGGQSGAGKSGGDPEAARKQAERRQKIALAFRLNRFAASFYRQELEKAPAARAYLREERKVSPLLERNFYVGYAPNSWDSLARHLQSAKAPLKIAERLGLVRTSTRQSSSGYFDLFRNRVLFPILDLRGRVAGFGGRSLDSEEKPKYLNSPESALFQKSKLAYGLFQAQKHVRERDEVILVEGYFDVIALHGAGFENAAATCGTSLTEDHLRLFRRFCSKVTVLFDGDDAGQKAMVRAMELGLREGVILHGAILPEGMDPDELVLRGPDGVEELKEILSLAKPILDARLEEEALLAQKDSESRTLALKNAARWLSLMKDPVARGVRRDWLVERMGVRPELLETAVRQEGGGSISAVQAQGPGQARAQANAQSPRRKPEPAPALALQRPVVSLHPLEKTLLEVLPWWSDFDELWLEIRRNLPPRVTFSRLFESQVIESLTAQMFETPGGIEKFREMPATFLSEIQDAQVVSIITKALFLEKCPHPVAEVRKAAYGLLKQVWARFSHGLRAELRAAEARKDAELHAKLMKDYLDVQRRMKEFYSSYGETVQG